LTLSLALRLEKDDAAHGPRDRLVRRTLRWTLPPSAAMRRSNSMRDQIPAEDRVKVPVPVLFTAQDWDPPSARQAQQFAAADGAQITPVAIRSADACELGQALGERVVADRYGIGPADVAVLRDHVGDRELVVDLD
jgi:hypothetical protein